MNRRNSYETAFVLFVIAALFVLLFIFRYWPAIQWAVLGIVAIVVAGVMANVIYAFVSLELGYSTEDEKAKRLRKHSYHAPQRLRAMLHAGLFRHR